MTKKSIIASIALASTSLFATNDMFVGVEVGNTEASFKASLSGYSLNENYDAGHQAVKIGKFFKIENHSFRTVATIFNYNSEDGSDVESWAVNIDYLIGDDKFKPFAGLHLANFDYEMSGLKALGYNNDSVSLSDTAIGFHFGGLYSIDEKFDFEAGYRITPISATDSNSVTDSGTVYPIDFKVEDAKAWYFGLNYKF